MSCLPAGTVGKGQVTHFPICFPEVLSVELATLFVVDQGFPLSPMGIIHLKQSMTQYAPIPANGMYQIEAYFVPFVGGLMFSETDKGIELKLHVVMTDKKSDLKVWEGDTVLLSRGKGGGSRRPPQSFDKPQWDKQSLHDVAGNTGLKYAKVSGDYNPHHLYKWSAMIMGFKQPIAHGLWTLGILFFFSLFFFSFFYLIASALQELMVLEPQLQKKYPIQVECEFKKPLFMPGKVTFGYKKRENDVLFGVYDKNNEDPHIICTLK